MSEVALSPRKTQSVQRKLRWGEKDEVLKTSDKIQAQLRQNILYTIYNAPLQQAVTSKWLVWLHFLKKASLNYAKYELVDI